MTEKEEVRDALMWLMPTAEDQSDWLKDTSDEEWEVCRKSVKQGTAKSLIKAMKATNKAAKKNEKQIVDALKDMDEMPLEIRKDIDKSVKLMPRLAKKPLCFDVKATVKKKTAGFLVQVLAATTGPSIPQSCRASSAFPRGALRAIGLRLSASHPLGAMSPSTVGTVLRMRIAPPGAIALDKDTPVPHVHSPSFGFCLTSAGGVQAALTALRSTEQGRRYHHAPRR